MARNGKIARLSRDLRHQLNTRLADGAEARQILPWLNALPEVQAVLAELFDSRPINDQNLSEWRHGGHAEWLAAQDILAQAQDLAVHRQELQSVAPGQSLADHLAAAVAFRFASILSAPGQSFDESTIGQLRALGRTCQAVVKLRRSDQNATRLKIETERWELTRPNLAAQNAADLKRRQRDTLAAPVWAAARAGEHIEKFGDGPAGRFAVEYLREIETCPDPANFESKVLTAEMLEKLERHVEETKKNPPVKRTEVQAAIEMLREIDSALDKHGEIKPAPKRSREGRPVRRGVRAKAGQPRLTRKASRKNRKPAKCRTNRRGHKNAAAATPHSNPNPAPFEIITPVPAAPPTADLPAEAISAATVETAGPIKPIQT